MLIVCHKLTLTPALSLRERENLSPVLLRITGRRLLGRFEGLRECRLLFPLPAGEGQGEGERHDNQSPLERS